MAVLRRWIFAIAILVAAPLHAQADSARMEIGRHYTQWLYAGQADSLWAKFSPEMREAVPSAQALGEMRQQIYMQIGGETEVVKEEIVEPSPVPGLTVYVRTARFAEAPMLVNVTVATDSAGVIQGFSVRPQRPAPEATPER
jgi:hypothetical protein